MLEGTTLSNPDCCYPGTSATNSLYFMLILQKLWVAQWVWPIIAYTFILYSEIRTILVMGQGAWIREVSLYYKVS